MIYALVIYNRDSATLLDLQSFEDRQVALDARFNAERNWPREGSDIEFVVLAAHSDADLRRTHARYFNSLEELAEKIS